MKIHLHLCCALPPKAFRHLLFQVSPCEAKSDKREKDMELIGNRSQVAKAWVRKTSIRRFESDRFLQRRAIPPIIFYMVSG